MVAGGEGVGCWALGECEGILWEVGGEEGLEGGREASFGLPFGGGCTAAEGGVG